MNPNTLVNGLLRFAVVVVNTCGVWFNTSDTLRVTLGVEPVGCNPFCCCLFGAVARFVKSDAANLDAVVAAVPNSAPSATLPVSAPAAAASPARTNGFSKKVSLVCCFWPNALAP